MDIGPKIFRDQTSTPWLSPVEPIKVTAGYGERMLGGVRGGGRKAPLYLIYRLSILTDHYLSKEHLSRYLHKIDFSLKSL